MRCPYCHNPMLQLPSQPVLRFVCHTRRIANGFDSHCGTSVQSHEVPR